MGRKKILSQLSKPIIVGKNLIYKCFMKYFKINYSIDIHLYN